MVSGGPCGWRAPRGRPIVIFEPPQRSKGPENHKEKQDCTPREAGDTDARERPFAVSCPAPEFGIGDERETGVEGGWIERIAHQRPCLEMGREIVSGWSVSGNTTVSRKASAGSSLGYVRAGSVAIVKG